MRLLFVHGWGFDSEVWDALAARLPAHDAARVELGFLGDQRLEPIEADDDTIAIGHSLGAMWLLKNLPQTPRALVSISGFARFSPPVPREAVALMKEGVMKKPYAQLKHFWRSCSIGPYAAEAALDADRLGEGLDWLMQWDATAELRRLACPRLVLAADDDRVVSPAMSEAQWGAGAIVWADAGGHALPLTRPAWCAERIGEFIDRL